jgi:acyl-coenzyme A synthetase/AMP-(fatty) acid ligase
LMTMAKEPGIAIDDVLVAITTPSFDISVLELFLPLTVGAKVVIATREQVTQGEHLAQLLNESRATIMQATPSGWRLLLEASWAGKPDLVALTGGEALSTELAASLLSRTRTLWNCYGPTETTVWSMLERVASVTDGITIGRPIANTTLYVLDTRLRPVVPGATGELYIGGLGVTRGYWKRPELDLERFVKDPFARELPNSETARMYKTGDLVRMRWDGRLEWLGRSDFQVKVRGHRIELPEIEARLSAIPGILEAVAIVREDRPNDQRIVAYVRAAGVAPAEDALRENLRACLPGYMVPQHIVTLDAFPQTPNGKIDRKALPPPNVVATAVRLPETATEVRLATEIGELLGVPQVGLDSDFFSLGGHSLLAQRLTVRVRSLWGVEMPMRHVFASPTLKGLADFIDAASSARNAVPILSNIAGGETEEFVL